MFHFSGFLGYLKEIQGISGNFQIMCFKGVSKKFQGCSKKVFRVLQGSLKGVSMEFLLFSVTY